VKDVSVIALCTSSLNRVIDLQLSAVYVCLFPVCFYFSLIFVLGGERQNTEL
jgi:hypothetical protein